MGTPKQLLKWKNTTLLGNIIEVAIYQDSNIFVILGANFELIKAAIIHYDIHISKNEKWKIGIGSSIAFGVNQIIKKQPKIDAILILLADQPLISAKYLNSLIDKYQINKKQIIASFYKNGKQGVPVLFDKTYIEELLKLNDDRGAKVLLQKYNEHVLTINAESYVSDIDTQEEYRKLYEANH